MSSSNCCFLTCIQISQEPGQVVWYSYLFQNFPQLVVIHRVKGFGIVNKADVFLELSHFFDDPTDVKSSLNIWKFTVHEMLKPGLENFQHYFASVWDKCKCAVVWAFFSIAFLWDWHENWFFSSPVAPAEFSKFAGILSAALSQPSNQGRPQVGKEGKCKPVAGPKSLVSSAERLLTRGSSGTCLLVCGLAWNPLMYDSDLKKALQGNP